MAKQVIGIDFDHTLWDTPNNRPMEGAQEALRVIRERGHKVLIHSCNNPAWIRQMCEDWDLPIDYVWGETGLEAGKPVCAIYVDDRAHFFQGNWANELPEILGRVSGRPVQDYRGPNYIRNPQREAELDTE